jgi:hypothetical protein
MAALLDQDWLQYWSHIGPIIFATRIVTNIEWISTTATTFCCRSLEVWPACKLIYNAVSLELGTEQNNVTEKSTVP